MIPDWIKWLLILAAILTVCYIFGVNPFVVIGSLVDHVIALKRAVKAKGM
jgi:hypothetical protein